MKKIILVLALVLTTTFIPTKKAEAGVLLMGATGGLSVVITGYGAYYAAPGAVYMVAGVFGDEPLNFVVGGFAVGYGGLFILLDEEVDEADKLSTIPEYVFDEINQIALSKKNSGVEIDENIKEVQFSEKEVAEVFELLDERTTLEDRAELRELLLEPIAL